MGKREEEDGEEGGRGEIEVLKEKEIPLALKVALKLFFLVWTVEGVLFFAYLPILCSVYIGNADGMTAPCFDALTASLLHCFISQAIIWEGARQPPQRGKANSKCS